MSRAENGRGTRRPGRATFTAGSTLVEVREGDITALGEPFDALVSSDDNHLTHGGGVSAALWSAGGPEIDAHAARLPLPMRLGDVVVTSAGRLASRYLLHGVTIDLDECRFLGPLEAPTLFRNVFLEAQRLRCRRIGLPLLGSGAGRLQPKAAALACATALAGFLDAKGDFDAVVLVVIPRQWDDAAGAFRATFGGWEPLRIVGERAVRSAAESEVAEALSRDWDRFKQAEGPAVLELVGLLHSAVDVVLETSIRYRARMGFGIQDAHGAEERRNPRSSLGQRLARLHSTLSGDGGVSRDLMRALESAVATRNRLAHGGGSPSESDAQVVREALRRSFSYIVDHSGPVRDAESIPPVVQAEPAVRARLHDGAVVPAPSSGSMLEALPGSAGGEQAVPPAGSLVRDTESDARLTSGTESVRRLHRFLLGAMNEEGRRDLERRLEDEGYRGSFENQLLEYCVRVEDPAEALREYCSRGRLRDEVEKVGGRFPPASATRDALAAELLCQFGFPSAATPVGLPTIRRAIDGGLSEVPGTSSVEAVTGLVIDSAKRLERALRIVLRFFSQAAFRMAPEVLFREIGALDKVRTLDKLSLGSLIDLTVRLDRLLRDREDPGLDLFRRDFATVGLLKPGHDSLAAIRNNFSHFQEGREFDLSAAHRHATDFYREALNLLDSLKERGLFPVLISIREIRFDRWGRRLVVAVTDEGRKEYVFTDEQLRPGEVYFMHPLTNPFRVDPILHRAGSLGSD